MANKLCLAARNLYPNDLIDGGCRAVDPRDDIQKEKTSSTREISRSLSGSLEILLVRTTGSQALSSLA